MSRHAILAAALGSLFLVPVASGDIVMSNLSAADDDGGTLFGPGSTTVFKAYGWTMPGDAYTLDAVTLRMFDYNEGEARVSIWDGASAPENELFVLDNPGTPGGGPDWFDTTFTPGSSFTLEAGANYWVYVEALNGGGDGYLWGDTTPSTEPSGIGTSLGYIFNGNPSTFRNAIEVTGSLVPAPGALCLLGIGALARRRRRD